MLSKGLLQKIGDDKNIMNIFRTIFKEKENGSPGISITKLSEKTGIEQHRLAGMVDILKVLGIISIFEIGMTKLVTPTETFSKLKSAILK